MNRINLENIIPLTVIQQLTDFFNNNTSLHSIHPSEPNLIKIRRPWPLVKDIINPYLSEIFDTSVNMGGNFYKHVIDYGPHVDSDNEFQTINCLLPLQLPDSTEQQHFVIFDQFVDNGFGAVWMCGVRSKLPELSVNSRALMYPYEDNRIYGKVDGLDEDFYNKYLKHGSTVPDMYKGLTGTAYKYKPGNLILFNSNQVHTTGRMVVPWKLGLFLQFKGSLDELLKQVA